MNVAVDVVVTVIAGVGLIVLGRWGLKNAETLPAGTLSQSERRRRRRVLVRGAVTCQCVGIAFVVVSAIRPFL